MVSCEGATDGRFEWESNPVCRGLLIYTFGGCMAFICALCAFFHRVHSSASLTQLGLNSVQTRVVLGFTTVFTCPT